ncbi:hypothetical protein SPSIL_014720 [Sporomusa silvacetica DSM 10669]|uniref:Uncharacterized protein n=1 Tax=Sporomusa silvacetica DSM 10669 TaxID=1123289 RepID=A0ABZ3II59_9FIRM|nr:hypothetical protein [Sporomusa silvacetica]OZC21534.1 hypothetical protein SPSIL_09450 [Sporomusa silvacetica DSM 10669]
MKKIIFLTLVMLFSFSIIASATAGVDVWVNGHYRSDGSYVDGHYRSDPDGNKDNNWSTRGNVNPHTGERGDR